MYIFIFKSYISVLFWLYIHRHCFDLFRKVIIIVAYISTVFCYFLGMVTSYKVKDWTYWRLSQAQMVNNLEFIA